MTFNFLLNSKISFFIAFNRLNLRIKQHWLFLNQIPFLPDRVKLCRVLWKLRYPLWHLLWISLLSFRLYDYSIVFLYSCLDLWRGLFSNIWLFFIFLNWFRIILKCRCILWRYCDWPLHFIIKLSSLLSFVHPLLQSLWQLFWMETLSLLSPDFELVVAWRIESFISISFLRFRGHISIW